MDLIQKLEMTERNIQRSKHMMHIAFDVFNSILVPLEAHANCPRVIKLMKEA